MTAVRRLVSAAAATLVGAGLLVATGTGAWAHGAATSPGSRTYLCYEDGRWTGGDIKPRNAACAQAVADSGTQPLWDWFGVLRSDGAGRMSGYIEDGQLCSGGNTKYAAYDTPSANWPVTHLTSGAKFTFHYNAWAPHPGNFYAYVTKDGFDPTKPLAWSDLESTPFSTWAETTPNGTGEYYWDATLPSGKSGRHIIYTVWSRTDSKETFYNCSDVVFDGGTGLVTGYPNASGGVGDSGTPTTGATSTPGTGSSASPGTSASPSSAQTSPAAAQDSTCDVGYKVVSSWPGGFQAAVELRNSGAAVSNWALSWNLPSGVTLGSGWGANVTSTGGVVTAKAPAYGASLAAGSTTTIGYLATGTSTTPTGFALNGVACSVNGTAAQRTAATPVASTPAATPSSSSSGGAAAGSTEGFESQSGATVGGGWSVVSKDCSGTGTAVIDSAVAHSGSKSLRVNGGSGYCNHVFAKAPSGLLPASGQFFARVFVKHTTALPAGHVTFMALNDAADNNTDLRIGGQNAALQWNRQSDDATLPEQSPNGVAKSTALPTGDWQCLEFTVNPSTGTAQTWLNGKEVAGLTADGTKTQDIDGQWYNKSWRPKLTDWRLGWESYGGGEDTLWYDDIAVGTSRVGC